ncbi:MAG: class I tRNA ligase family protein [Myxococcota bacterium]
MTTPFYVTTPLYYPNADPHLGSAYTTTVADMLVRWHRASGEETLFLTGIDEHGEKMAQTAAAQGVDPRTFVDRMAPRFRDRWRELGLRPDRFLRTTDADHVRAVQHFWQTIYDRGEVEFRDYTGLYCVGCEAFMTPSELENGRCPHHDRAPEERSEGNYFFRMSDHFDWLRAELDAEPERITPARFKNEVLGMIAEGALSDLCITRPVSRLSWGVPAPWDEGYVLYVWADALVNYLTGAGYPDDPAWERRWTGVHHLIGKDILKAHGVFWPTMLHATGIPIYRGLHVHGHWVLAGRKISKSAGSLVDALGLRSRYGFEALRYYMLREMPYGLDTEFSEEGLVRCLNADLANGLGNLASRVLGMVERYLDGRVPETNARETPGALGGAVAEAFEAMGEALARTSSRDALATLWGVIAEANRFVEANAPWKLARDPGRRVELHSVLYEALEALRQIACLLEPFLPETSAAILERLGVGAPLPFDRALRWGGLPAGARVSKGEPLFPRVEEA